MATKVSQEFMDRVLNAAWEAQSDLSNPGFCVGCGEEHDGCEPDMRRGHCDSCGQNKVYGAEALVLRLS